MTDYRIVTNGHGGYLVEQRKRFLWWSWWGQPFAAHLFTSREQAERDIQWRRQREGPWTPIDEGWRPSTLPNGCSCMVRATGKEPLTHDSNRVKPA